MRSDRSLPWIDRLKAVALAWVILNHIVEHLVGGAAAANPSFPWPPLAARIAQFNPVHGRGALGWLLTAVRDLGWFGDQGVTLFLILSGFGLTYGLLARNAPPTLNVGQFYRRRAFRILPLWWGAHLLFLPLGILTGTMTPGNWQFYASLAGLRFLPSVFYFFSPAWWYIGLLLQLYLVYPLLWRILRARGATTLFVLGCAIGFVSIALGPYLFHNSYLDAWQRGAFYVTRLPEFTLGMALGAWWYRRPEPTEALLRSPLTPLAGVVLYGSGTVLSFTLTGMIVAPLLLGAGAFAIIFPFVARPARRDDAVQRIGRHSYSLYLAHDPLITFLVPVTFAPAKIALGIVAALIATAAAAWILERATPAVEGFLGRSAARYGRVATTSGVLALAAAVFAVALAGDLAVQRFAPQEVLGWGERASLEPSQRFGWKLIPSRTTRLRWESYDYRVTANALGFPGPEFPAAKPPHTLRILVTGDAFSSAEGVDTDRAWPRLLQSELAENGGYRTVQVMNFSITGYGPDQEAAVVKAFAPRFHPDVVLIEMFANDVADAQTSNAQFHKSIGFGEPPQTGTAADLKLLQLSAYLRARVAEPLRSLFTRTPERNGYFLGNFSFLERGSTQYRQGLQRSIADYDAIARAARAVGAKTIVAFVPAPVQVCGRHSLAYYPRFVNVHDRAKYDLGLPQRRGRAIAAAAGVTFWDLSPALLGFSPCPYMPRNMHFTANGNRAVAALLAQRLRRQLAARPTGTVPASAPRSLRSPAARLGTGARRASGERTR